MTKDLMMATILIIDDDASMRRLMVRTLGTGSHTLIEAQNGQEGLDLVGQHKPDVVVTDILMPRKEGIETIREIRELAPNIRIIAVSGGGSAHNLMFLDIAKVFGADIALAKPFRPNELVEAVEEALRRDVDEGAA
jgi:CheY-like chemotaxis protein